MKKYARLPIAAFHSASIKFCIILLFFFITGKVFSQVTITESFDAVQFPPNGWKQIPIYGVNTTNLYDRVISSTLPNCVPHTGAGFLRYRSKTALPIAASCLVSKRIDLSGRTSCNAPATVSFWFYRDNTSTTLHDSLRVYIDTANNYFSNTKVALNGGPAPALLTRPYLDAPAAAANSWQQYTYNIPAGRCTDHEYIMFVTGSAGGGNMYIDDINVTSWPSVQAFNKTEITYQEVIPVSKGSTTQVIVGVNVQMDNAGTPAFSLDSISLNTNGTSSLSDIQNAKLWYTAGSGIYYYVQQFGNTIVNPSLTTPFPGNLTFKQTAITSGTITTGQKYVVAGGAGCSVTHNAIVYNNGTVFTAVNTSFSISGNPLGQCCLYPYFPLEVGDNYFWLTYDVPVSATAGNCVDAEYSGCYLGEDGVLNAANVITMPGCREINSEYCNGTIPVLTWGTSEMSDFVRHVALWGEGFTNPTLPVIDNALNTVGPPGAPYFGGPAPFCAHPPDYELFNPTNHTTCVLKQSTTYSAPASNFSGPGLSIQADADVGFDPNYVNAWIDFNRDGDFTDAGEKLIPAAVALYGLNITNVPITVPPPGLPSPGVAGPAGSVVGPTRMRVRAGESITNIDPCQGGMIEGETEDYIVTIMPSCPPGVKTWLGYTDDWNTPSNWCGGVPSINDVALIQFSASGTFANDYHRPVIHTGVNATAQTIRLASGDTLYVDAQNSASLTIKDSLRINYNTPGNGHIKVISNYSSTGTISNGTLSFNITPFTATRKNQRMQIVYTATDFNTQGIFSGDVIDELWFDIYARATNPYGAVGQFQGIYNGFTLSYAYCTSGWNAWPAAPPVALATAGAYTTIYSGNLDLNQPVVSGGLGSPSGTGTLKIPVTSFVYTGGDVVFNFCYNNSLVGLSTPPIVTNDLVRQTVTTNAYRTMWINNSNSTAPYFGCILNWPTVVGNTYVVSYYRPNITFKYHKTFNKFPINMGTSAAVVNGVTVVGTVAGHFDNNNNGAALTDGFDAGRSVVTFAGNAANQNITGIKSTKFNDLTVNKTTGTVTQQRAATVDSLLMFTNGPLLLNSLTLTANYGIAPAVSRTNGYMVSEDPAANGKLSWNIGANDIGVNHVFPFGVLGGIYIPVSINPGADLGIVSIATYHTNWDNTPYPAPATHVNNATGSPNNGTLTVDRFWVLNKTGPAANNAGIIFSYNNTETNAPNVINKSTLIAQRWVGAGWSPGIGTSTVGGSVSTQSLFGINTNFYGPWALTDISNPLPIELIHFDAAAVNDKVKVWWKTASETDNDYFTVERTVDLKTYDFIARVATQGNGPFEHVYETYDLNPVTGLQYYRLKTTSVNNEETFSNLVPVHFNDQVKFEIIATISQYDAGVLGVDYFSNSNEPCDLILYDVTGHELLRKNNISTASGVNHVDVGVVISHGVYLISLENTQQTAVRKLVF